MLFRIWNLVWRSMLQQVVNQFRLPWLAKRQSIDRQRAEDRRPGSVAGTVMGPAAPIRSPRIKNGRQVGQVPVGRELPPPYLRQSLRGRSWKQLVW